MEVVNKYSHQEDIMHSFQKFIVSFLTILPIRNKDMKISCKSAGSTRSSLLFVKGTSFGTHIMTCV